MLHLQREEHNYNNPLFECDKELSPGKSHFQHLLCLNSSVVLRTEHIPEIDLTAFDEFEFNCDRCVLMAKKCKVKDCTLSAEISLSMLLHCKECDFVFHHSCGGLDEYPENHEWPCPVCDVPESDDQSDNSSDHKPMKVRSTVVSKMHRLRKGKKNRKKPAYLLSRAELAAMPAHGPLTIHHFAFDSASPDLAASIWPRLGQAALDHLMKPPQNT